MEAHDKSPGSAAAQVGPEERLGRDPERVVRIVRIAERERLEARQGQNDVDVPTQVQVHRIGEIIVLELEYEEVAFRHDPAGLSSGAPFGSRQALRQDARREDRRGGLTTGDGTGKRIVGRDLLGLGDRIGRRASLQADQAQATVTGKSTGTRTRSPTTGPPGDRETVSGVRDQQVGCLQQDRPARASATGRALVAAVEGDRRVLRRGSVAPARGDRTIEFDDLSCLQLQGATAAAACGRTMAPVRLELLSDLALGEGQAVGLGPQVTLTPTAAARAAPQEALVRIQRAHFRSQGQQARVATWRVRGQDARW